MIRQLRNVACPALGTQANQLDAPIYAFRVDLATGCRGVPGALNDRVWVTMVRKDGADEQPVIVDPASDGWICLPEKATAIRLNSFGPAASIADLWYATDRRDLPPPQVKRQAAQFPVWIGTVMAGGALDTGSIYTGPIRRLAAMAYNASAVARDLAFDLLSEDNGATVITGNLITGIPAGSTRIGWLGQIEVAGAPGATVVPYPLSGRIRFTVAAGGAALFNLTVWGQS